MFPRLCVPLLFLLAVVLGACAPARLVAFAPAGVVLGFVAAEPAEARVSADSLVTEVAVAAPFASIPVEQPDPAAGTGPSIAASPSCPPRSDSVWQVEVVEATAVDEYGPYYFERDTGHHFVSLTLALTYLGSGSVDFYPEGVVLVHVGEVGLTGFGDHPESTATFLYEFPVEYTEFLLLFPSSDPITVTLQR